MPFAVLRLHLERARDCECSSNVAWCADIWQGVPGQGAVVEGVKGVKQVSMPPGIYKNSTKNGRFPALVDIKVTEKAVFNSKFINKKYSQEFFENYINFKNFCSLKRCGVIPVQSFGSHITPPAIRIRV
jgi:hypothetical protein